MKETPPFPARRAAPPVAQNVSREFMIASPPQLQMSPVAMIVSPTHSVRCNYREPDMPMIASPGADDCKPLQVARHLELRAAAFPQPSENSRDHALRRLWSWNDPDIPGAAPDCGLEPP